MLPSLFTMLNFGRTGFPEVFCRDQIGRDLGEPLLLSQDEGSSRDFLSGKKCHVASLLK